MATPASIRLPLRLLARRATANPVVPTVTHLSRPQQHNNNPYIPFSRRHASGTTAPPGTASEATVTSNPTESNDESLLSSLPDDVRLPRAVQAVYLRPLRKKAQYGAPSASLQLRSYNVRNLEFFADFAMRAAYYLNLPAYGPVPLPRIVERWTVPRASFIYKKSQENFERKTLRRLITIKDGHPETVQIWLAFLKKHAYYGIGMKANVWTYENLDVAKNMDAAMENLQEEADEKWRRLALTEKNATAEKIMEFIDEEGFKAANGTRAPMADERAQ